MGINILPDGEQSREMWVDLVLIAQVTILQIDYKSARSSPYDHCLGSASDMYKREIAGSVIAFCVDMNTQVESYS
jgi:hypothetical protein